MNIYVFSLRESLEMFRPSAEASTAAAELFLTNVMGRLSNTNYTLPQLRKSILPLYAIQWNRSILTGVGKNRLLDFFARVRISKLPKNEFVELAKFIRVE